MTYFFGGGFSVGWMSASYASGTEIDPCTRYIYSRREVPVGVPLDLSNGVARVTEVKRNTG